MSHDKAADVGKINLIWRRVQPMGVFFISPRKVSMYYLSRSVVASGRDKCS